MVKIWLFILCISGLLASCSSTQRCANLKRQDSQTLVDFLRNDYMFYIHNKPWDKEGAAKLYLQFLEQEAKLSKELCSVIAQQLETQYLQVDGNGTKWFFTLTNAILQKELTAKQLKNVAAKEESRWCEVHKHYYILKTRSNIGAEIEYLSDGDFSTENWGKGVGLTRAVMGNHCTCLLEDYYKPLDDAILNLDKATNQ